MTTCKKSGAIIWLTGLSGSGKSTLAQGLESLLKKQDKLSVVLDGDHLRKGLCADLGFSMKDRAENIRRVGEVAKLFTGSGILVICALISPLREARNAVRASCQYEGISFNEVFVDASLALCEERDPKGLYQKARTGKIKEFTGIDSSYEKPITPDLHLKTDCLSPEESLQKLHDFVTGIMGY